MANPVTLHALLATGAPGLLSYKTLYKTYIDAHQLVLDRPDKANPHGCAPATAPSALALGDESATIGYVSVDWGELTVAAAPSAMAAGQYHHATAGALPEIMSPTQPVSNDGGYHTLVVETGDATGSEWIVLARWIRGGDALLGEWVRPSVLILLKLNDDGAFVASGEPNETHGLSYVGTVKLTNTSRIMLLDARVSHAGARVPHAGARVRGGVRVMSGLGDGFYPVAAHYHGAGDARHVARLTVTFIGGGTTAS